MTSHTLAVLLACHNRRATTLACLDRLRAQQGLSDVTIQVFLVDDGSTDGTAQAVAAAHGDVEILSGSGSLFWCGAMRLAMEQAMRRGFDNYLWLNDDVQLEPQAIARMLELHRRHERPAVLVGATRDGHSGRVSYGGYVRTSRWNRLAFKIVPPPQEQPRPVDAMNGQFVLIPHAVAAAVGNLDEKFAQNFGDFDYALRARRRGFEVLLAPGYVGQCGHNPCGMLWREATLPWQRRWQLVTSPRQFPPRQLLRYARRHGGVFWPLLWLLPYVRALVLPIRHTPQALQAARAAGAVVDVKER